MHCDNPDCTRNHKSEATVAEAVEKVARNVAELTGGGPFEAMVGMVMALTTANFFNSHSGHEEQAGEDLVELVAYHVQMLNNDEEARAFKRQMDAEQEMEQRGTANGLPI